MSDDACVLDLALAQLESMEAPTAIVPVLRNGQEGVFFATYQGDADWIAPACAEEHAVDVAIACCKRADADAHARAGAQARPVGGDR